MAELWLVMGLLSLFNAGTICFCISLQSEIQSLKTSRDELKAKLGYRDGEVVKQLTENLDAELEKSANMTEMRRANRRHLPREDAGPPARVKRMKFNRRVV